MNASSSRARLRLAPERMSWLLVDDHPLFCDAMGLLLARRWPGLRLQHVGSLAQARDKLHALRPDLVLLDLNLPDARGLQALLALRDEFPALALLVISGDDRTELVHAAIEAGAAGFISKTADAEALCGQLQTVLDGGVCLPATCLGDAHATVAQRHAQAQALLQALSPRQLEVLRLLVQGLPNKTISRELALSEATVKTHVAAVFRKLGVVNRTQAVLAAAQLGLRL